MGLLYKSAISITQVAIAIKTEATVIDQIIDLHGRAIGGVFNKVNRTKAEKLKQSAATIPDKLDPFQRVGQALVEAKRSGLG